MKIRDDINDVCAALADLLEGLLDRADETKQVPIPMYTHLQQGEIGTFSHFLLSYVSTLIRDMERLYLCYQRINQSPLGACAIGGSAIPIDRKETAVALGFDSIVRNSVDATSSRDVFLEYVATLSIMASSLGRIAEDLIIWSTAEFGYIELADRFSSTSSAMPQKKNPDPLELVRAKSASIAGNLVSILGIVKALPSGYSRDMQDIKPEVLAASARTLSVLKTMNGVVRSMEVNRKRMHQAAKSSYAVAIDIAEQLVTEKKIPFRSAHKIVGEIVSVAVSKGNIPLHDLDALDIAGATKGLNLDAKDIEKIIKEMTPERSLQLRRSVGSPRLSEQEEMIKMMSQVAQNYKVGIQKRIKMVQGSFDSLAKAVDRYTKSSR
jgi:argininosuccinate lyase